MKSFTEFLTEIGSGTVKAYPWTQYYGFPDYGYILKAVDGETYKISVNLSHGAATVGFSKGHTEMGKSGQATDLGLTHALRMMHTVVEVTKDALLDAYKNHNTTRVAILFTVSGGDEEAPKKLKLYTAFAKKAFKGAKVKKRIHGFAVTIPKRFYK